MIGNEMAKSAILSTCGRYRFFLERAWAPGLGTCCWIMLNPSTADADVDDATVRKCIGFSDRWGYGRIVIVNLYAYRARDPKELKGVGKSQTDWETPQMRKHGIDLAIGRGNNAHIARAIQGARRVVVAWGNNATQHRANTVLQMDAFLGKRVWFLGLTKSRQPRHPLMLAYDTALMSARAPELVT